MKNINSYILEKLNINKIDLSLERKYPKFTYNNIANKTLFLLGYTTSVGEHDGIGVTTRDIEYVKEWISQNNITDVVGVINDSVFNNVSFSNQRKNYYIFNDELYNKIDDEYLHSNIDVLNKRSFITLSCTKNIISTDIFSNSTIYVIEKKYFDTIK